MQKLRATDIPNIGQLRLSLRSSLPYFHTRKTCYLKNMSCVVAYFWRLSFSINPFEVGTCWNHFFWGGGGKEPPYSGVETLKAFPPGLGAGEEVLRAALSAASREVKLEI